MVSFVRVLIYDNGLLTRTKGRWEKEAKKRVCPEWLRELVESGWGGAANVDV
jgi:hypothetical protein